MNSAEIDNELERILDENMVPPNAIDMIPPSQDVAFTLAVIALTLNGILDCMKARPDA